MQAREPMRADGVFRMASVAKPMTAIGIMILQEEGHLLIHSPVSRYLPAFEGPGVEASAEPARNGGQRLLRTGGEARPVER